MRKRFLLYLYKTIFFDQSGEYVPLEKSTTFIITNKYSAKKANVFRCFVIILLDEESRNIWGDIALRFSFNFVCSCHAADEIKVIVS